jgi:hypothetical protein
MRCRRLNTTTHAESGGALSISRTSFQQSERVLRAVRRPQMLVQFLRAIAPSGNPEFATDSRAPGSRSVRGEIAGTSGAHGSTESDGIPKHRACPAAEGGRLLSIAVSRPGSIAGSPARPPQGPRESRAGPLQTGGVTRILLGKARPRYRNDLGLIARGAARLAFGPQVLVVHAFGLY